MDRFERIVNRIVSTDRVMMELAMSFFMKNPNPSDDMLHAWAEKNEIDKHELEEAAYVLATFAARFFSGGKAVEENVTNLDVNPDELAMGVEVEKEHTPDPFVAARIALDHLAEIEDYYTRLKKMEEEAGVED